MNDANTAAKNLLLAAGGTGGHIWPAISFGRWIKSHHPECRVRYVCGSRPLEREIYSAAGEEPLVLPIDGSPLSGRSIGQRLGRLCSLYSSYSFARDAFARFKPEAALLFGGYLSFPMMLACKRAGVRCAIHEQNARAGKVTRVAAKLGVDIYCGWGECPPLSEARVLRTGVPVRQFARTQQASAWKALEIAEAMPSGPKVVVFTGSLGSQSIKDKICETARNAAFSDWSFILPAVSDSVRKAERNVWLLPKVWDASPLYSAADMLVLRGGGSTLTEAGVLGIPALVIPWRGAADNHQYHNALAFVSENIGVLFNEEEDASALASALKELNKIRENKNGGGCLKGQEKVICENLWSALFPAG